MKTHDKLSMFIQFAIMVLFYYFAAVSLWNSFFGGWIPIVGYVEGGFLTAVLCFFVLIPIMHFSTGIAMLFVDFIFLLFKGTPRSKPPSKSLELTHQGVELQSEHIEDQYKVNATPETKMRFWKTVQSVGLFLMILNLVLDTISALTSLSYSPMRSLLIFFLLYIHVRLIQGIIASSKKSAQVLIAINLLLLAPVFITIVGGSPLSGSEGIGTRSLMAFVAYMAAIITGVATLSLSRSKIVKRELSWLDSYLPTGSKPRAVSARSEFRLEHPAQPTPKNAWDEIRAFEKGLAAKR